MTILTETARRAKEKLAPEFEAITVERAVVGVFFSGVKLSNGSGGVGICNWEVPDSFSILMISKASIGETNPSWLTSSGSRSFGDPRAPCLARVHPLASSA